MEAEYVGREGIWHVIFMCEHEGKILEYCREEPDLIMDDSLPEMCRFANREETVEWADKMLKKHKLHSYRLEKW